MNRITGRTALALAAALSVLAIGSVIADEHKSDKHEGSEVKGSIVVKGQTGDALLAMAKVELKDALAAAVAKVPGKVWKAELEAEDGTLIYSIQLVTPAAEWKEINVDAGTGAVLAVENGDKDEFAQPEAKGKGDGKKGDKAGKDDDDD